MIPEGDPDLTTCLNKLPWTNDLKEQNKTVWFPKLENHGKNEIITPIQIQILKKLHEMKEKQKLNPKDDTKSRLIVPNWFNWTDTLPMKTGKQGMENILVETLDIVFRHRMDIGMNTKFMVQLIPKKDKVIHSRNLTMPIHLKEDLFIEQDLMHKYGIITVLTFSEYACPNFAQRKPNGKIRHLVDAWKITSLNADDYINNNHPVSTLSDAAKLLTELSFFCKLDCSQANHCFADGGPMVNGNVCIQFS